MAKEKENAFGKKEYKGGLPFAKTILVTFFILPLILIIIFLSVEDISKSYFCSEDNMRRLARERMSLQGSVLTVRKTILPKYKVDFNYCVEYYPNLSEFEKSSVPVNQKFTIWLKIECINGLLKVTNAGGKDWGK